LKFEVEPIGVVRNEVIEPRGQEWGQVISEIELKEELAPALDGLEEFSHIIVIFWFHRVAPGEFPLKLHPRGRQDLPLLGVLATRHSRRPNPIGLSIVRLLERRGNRLRVRGLDAFDGTPVLDIKPYSPSFDAPREATVPWWTEIISRLPYKAGRNEHR